MIPIELRTATMTTLNEFVSHLSPSRAESIQLKKGWELWYSGLNWYEKHVGSELTLKNAHDRLVAYHTVEGNSMFGAEVTSGGVLKLGSSGPDVTRWQKIVGVPQSGYFDQTTVDATKNYQRAHGLRADGKVGALTWGTVGPKFRFPVIQGIAAFIGIALAGTTIGFVTAK